MVELTVHPIVLLLSAAPILLHDTDVLYDTSLVANTEGSAYVSVRGASSLTESEPIAGAKVRLSIAGKEIARAETDAEGRAPLRFRVPQLEPASYPLTIETESPHGTDIVHKTVSVVRRAVLSLRTDRKVYRPGETIHFGVAVLNRPDAHPIGGTKVAISVKEPGGTEIWRGDIDVGATGFGAGKVALGEDLRLGKYVISSSVFSENATVDVSVRDVELPAFFVAIDAGGTVTARYPYGEPVQGKVEISAGGKTIENAGLDEFGRHSISAKAKSLDLLVARVTDGAERTESASWAPPREADQVSVVIAPEKSTLSLGRKQFVTVLTTDGNGRLAPASIELEGTGVEVHGAARRISLGAVRYAVRVNERGKLIARATSAKQKTAVAKLDLVPGGGGAWIRPLRAVHQAGEAIEIFGKFSRAKGPVVVTLLRGGIPLASAIGQMQEGDYFTAQLAAPEGAFGLATVRAVELGWSPKLRAPIERSAASSIYLVPASLDVSLWGESRFRPGETAELTALVKDAAGRPAKNVGLFASVVDERSLALGEKQKDLVQLLRSLDVDNAHLLGLVFTELLGATGDEHRLAARAIVESLPPEQVTPSIEIEAVARHQRETDRMATVRDSAIAALSQRKGPVGKRTGEGWEFSVALARLLVDSGWSAEQASTPWKQPLTWQYARALDRSISFAQISREVADRKMDELADALVGKRAMAAQGGILGLLRGGEIGGHLGTDPWGGNIALSTRGGGSIRSAGPDGTFGTGDDLVRGGVFESTGIGGLGSRGYGLGGGGYGRTVRMGMGQSVVLGAPAAIRSRFDETVLWAAGIVTDAEGKAILRVPFSDSVTGWLLDVDALGANGAVGHATKKLETFIPLSIDAAVPQRLTTGDRYTLAAVASNHTTEELALTMTIEARGAIGAAGESVRTVRLPSGTTGAARFLITANDAGVGTVLLSLSREDGTIVDRVERKIRVDGPGRLVQVVLTSQVSNDEESIRFNVPNDGEDFEGMLRVFRSPVDQALNGIEDLLSEPHGCFEQTSSATYPNLMVLQLLPKESQHEATREKAYDFVAKGYQRLISYEVSGGGFSWFGQSPANQALTAYGLMEFADMAKVYPVDPKLIDRTRQWLMAQQRDTGAWSPDATWLHDWSAVQGEVAITAYVTWALVESGYRGPEIDRALAFLARHEAELAKKPYLLALWAAASRSPELLAKLRAHQRKDAKGLAFGAGGETLFYVSGAAADVQVTALAVPLLRRTRALADADEAMRWIWSARAPRYGWGSPQGTVLALRAAAEMAASPSDGSLAVSLDGRSLGAIDLESRQVPALALTGVGGGAHVLGMDGPRVLTDLRMSWRTKDASTPVENGIAVELSVPRDPIAFGATARVVLSVENKSERDVPMPTAIIPVPPGFAANKRSLAALKGTKQIDRFEATGAAVHLYLSKLAKKQKIELAYDLVANAECEVTQRAARVYAYYDPDMHGESTNSRVIVQAASTRP